MADTIHYSSCPFCNSKEISFVLKAKDYTATQELFEIWKCAVCTGRFTQDAPSLSGIGRYYQSAEYVSHSNTNKGIVNSLYHKVRQLTLRTKEKLIQEETNLGRGKLLDIGAGVGAFAAHMKGVGWEVTGLEPDNATRVRAKELFNIDLGVPEQLYVFNDEYFDAVTMWHVLEHVHDLHGYLEKIRTSLKPKGKLFIAVPNFTSKDARSYEEYWAAYDVPRHLYHFSPAAMEKLLSLHGLRLQSMKPMWYDSYYVSMLSEKYKTGKQSLLKGTLRGLMSNANAMRTPAEASSLIYIASKS